MTGADFRAHELADDLRAAGWFVSVTDENGDRDRVVTVIATRPGQGKVTVAYRSVTAPGAYHATSLAHAELEGPDTGTRKLEGPRAVRAWLASAVRE